MYIPKAFEGSDAAGREIMQAHGWALLVTADAAGAPLATHLALHWQDDGSPHGALVGHLARANGHWRLFARPVDSLAMFWGPHAYVSPTWYTPGPKVPTWNYVTVHAYGRPEIVEDTAGARQTLPLLPRAGEGAEGRTPPALPPGNAAARPGRDQAEAQPEPRPRGPPPRHRPARAGRRRRPRHRRLDEARAALNLYFGGDVVQSRCK